MASVFLRLSFVRLINDALTSNAHFIIPALEVPWPPILSDGDPDSQVFRPTCGL